MLPLLTFASGIVAGIVGVRLLKKNKGSGSLKSLGQKACSGLDRAGEGLRDATVSGLSALEQSSASLRGQLTPSAPAAELLITETPDQGPVEAPRPEVADQPVAEAAQIDAAEQPHAETAQAEQAAARQARPRRKGPAAQPAPSNEDDA